MTECVFSEVDVSLCRCFKVVMDYNTLYMCVRERERVRKGVMMGFW